jgi:hypothetical protein
MNTLQVTARPAEVNGSAYAPSLYGDARRIEWEGDFPADLRAIVEPVLAPLERVLPMWCQTLVLRHSPNLESTLQVEISIRNRWVLVRVGPGWFAHPHAEREGSMIHEFCHVLIEPFNWAARRALDAYAPAEGQPARSHVDNTVSDGLEQAVEDMARALQKALRG